MVVSQLKRELEAAWKWRLNRGLIEVQGSLRVFHGSGDGTHELKNISIDRFEEPSGSAHYWVTEWEASGKAAPLEGIQEFLRERGATSAVALLRPEKGVPSEPRVILGAPPDQKFTAREGRTLFKIRLIGAKHPGLFLDHYPLRRWLGASARDLRVLNTFSYTGSLSIAAGLGGASHVTTLDLSQPTILWAEENWALNGLAPEKARFIYGDYFEWLPRLKRENKKFDLAILDPPSFSRSKNGTFSTSKDLRKLHALIFGVLEPESCVVK
jgi:23S rRNA (cytosine1962-C5)-methyltransferase